MAEVSGPVSFHVTLKDGQVRGCHQDQSRIRVTATDSIPQEVIEEESAHDDVAMAIPTSSREDSTIIASGGGGTNSESTSRTNHHAYPPRNLEAPEKFQSSWNT